MDDPDAKFPWHFCPVLKGDHQQLGIRSVHDFPQNDQCKSNNER